MQPEAALSAADNELPEQDPEVGQLVHVRSRRWLVEGVEPGDRPGESSRVRLACAEDDAQGEEIEVFWDVELDRRSLKQEGWGDLAARGFDTPRRFAAFLHALRWNSVTATDPNLFQAPFRAGIKLDAYQMEPLRKALRVPRVNLFIADDTGLGKTIEAGLIARELLLRKKIRTIVVSAPASVLEQWQAEMEERFGLLFAILDRAYLARMRRERGFGVNPWTTHSRFLVSHSLLRDPTYADPMRAWLGPVLRGSLLILDEAHHAAPSSGGRYGIESQFTRAVRDLSERFEHRLFLSATPHNGHSNSFSTLLELLDPHRFTRGVKVRKESLDAVMVRRLKEDIREVQGGFPRRNVVRVELDGLPEDAPELELSRLLDEYREARTERFRTATKSVQAASGLLVVGLQQRLLSSIEAFAFSLRNHRKTVERHRAGAAAGPEPGASRRLRERTPTRPVAAAASPDRAEGEARVRQAARLFVAAPPGADDDGRDEDAAGWTSDEAEQAEERQIEAIGAGAEAALDPRAADGTAAGTDEALWRREAALLDRMERIAASARGRPDAKVRHLLDWIRQRLCPGLPPLGTALDPGASPPRWNDRRLLIFTENRVGTKRYLRTQLETAIASSDRAGERIVTIDGHTRGAARRVIDDSVERLLNRGGIPHGAAHRLAAEIEAADLAAERKRATREELESARKRRGELQDQIDRCQTLLQNSRKWVRFEVEPFRDALSCSLELLGAKPLQRTRNERGETVWTLPDLDRQAGGDPAWAGTLDSLRRPRRRNQKLADWRRRAPPRPVIFEDAGVLTDETVHLHLEQRVAQRLLARFRSQGFLHHDLSRACLAQAADSIPRVILLGRLSLYGGGAERLHEEVVAVAARWVEPERPAARERPSGSKPLRTVVWNACCARSACPPGCSGTAGRSA